MATVRDAATLRDARDGRRRRAGDGRRVRRHARADLPRTVTEMDGAAARGAGRRRPVVQLANALVRLQRVEQRRRAVVTAEEHLRAFLRRGPEHYEARRMLATVLLSQHRFRDAIAEGESARADPRDAWNYGVIGDGHLELGDYEHAFAAFDRMGQLAPGPSAYARIAYALEIKGDLDGALEIMRMAADGTTPNDAEGQAWHYAQVGDLLLQLGRIGDARREFERAAATFPNHPLALTGPRAHQDCRGRARAARLLLQGELAKTPTPELAAVIGDLSERSAIRQARRGTSGWPSRSNARRWSKEPPQPQALARFLAERDREHSPKPCASPSRPRDAPRHLHDGRAGRGVLQGRPARGGPTGGRCGDADRHARRAPAVACGRDSAAAGEPAAALELLRRIPARETIAEVRVRAGILALHERLNN